MLYLNRRALAAIDALIVLARAPAPGRMQRSEIQARLGLTDRSFESALFELVKAGMVESRRGVGGGYRLSRPVEELTVMSVLQALGETGRPATEGGETPEPAAGVPAIRRLQRDFWNGVEAKVVDMLSRTTLGDILENEDALTQDTGAESAEQQRVREHADAIQGA
ncbi:MAG: Rrf2 family transcriptional regulator [Alphaproteobacteria bacterium]|nr:Rrf2 family transcriptional regulator [Alphaproteobacteria bacterium]